MKTIQQMMFDLFILETDAMWKMFKEGYSIKFLYDNCIDIHNSCRLEAFLLNRIGFFRV